MSELNCGTLSWCQRIAWWEKTHTLLTYLVTRSVGNEVFHVSDKRERHVGGRREWVFGSWVCLLLVSTLR